MNNDKIENSIIIYEGKNGAKVELNLKEDTMWASQKKMGEIFECTTENIILHIQNIIKSSELEEISVTKDFLVTASDGKNYNVKHYNLDMIIAVGYRVNSAKATQFRIWATKILKEYIVKGFAMDDERLKNPSTNQYFRELLERVREIRSSEKLFYQQVKDIYTTAIDYQEKKDNDDIKLFFSKIQNKLIYAITEKTAAELIVARINKNDINCGLFNWEGSKVRLKDIDISKNYLNQKELEKLKLLVNQLLDYLESQTLKRKAITLKDWEVYTNKLIEFNEYRLLNNAGKISHKQMEQVAKKEYKEFDNSRKQKEREEAEREALKDIKNIEKEVKEILAKKQNKV